MKQQATIFFHSELDDPQAWQATLQAALPQLCFITGPKCDAPEEVDIALLWTQPPQGLQAFTGLRAVLSLGAGVDQLRLDALPPGEPVARLIDQTLTQRMVEYCQATTLYFHRHLHLHASQQARQQWYFIPPVNASARRVLVLGLGELGSAVAKALARQGFDVSGWSRTAKLVPGFVCLQGEVALQKALGGCDILINLLPLTAQTRGLLDHRLFEWLKTGACLVQVGRGGHLVEDDLLEALADGRLGGAFLDVFAVEPLPADHPFWAHPQLRLTPHVALLSDPVQSAAMVIENIRRTVQGQPLLHAIKRASGY